MNRLGVGVGHGARGDPGTGSRRGTSAASIGCTRMKHPASTPILFCNRGPGCGRLVSFPTLLPNALPGPLSYPAAIYAAAVVGWLGVVAAGILYAILVR